MNEQLARSKFPTIRRSGLTVSASGIPGAPTRPANQSRVLPPSRFAPILIERDLYEADNEGPSIGKFTADNDFFILESAARRKYSVRTLVSRETPQRPPPPLLLERDNAQNLPKKTASGFHRSRKGKRRRKGRPTNEVKRPRSLPEDRPKPARISRSVPKKSIFNAPPPRIKVKSPEKRSRADTHIPPHPPLPSAIQSSPQRYRRARKVAFDPPHVPTATPTPPPDYRGARQALDVVAQGIFRLDPPLARYSLRSTPLFLARNLRDGWSGKIWSWDEAARKDKARQNSVGRTDHRDPQVALQRLEDWVAKAVRQVSRYTPATITQPSLPRTFYLKLRRFELGAVARAKVPDFAKLAASLYIHNNPGDGPPLIFDLGVSNLELPKSDAGLLEVPLRIPSSEFHKKNTARTDTLVPFFVETANDDIHVSLRALSLPRSIAYVGVLLYDFTEIGTPAGETVTWGDGASRLYSRIDLVGPNASASGFATQSQRTPAGETVTWGDGASRLYSRIDLVGPNASASGFATQSQRAETIWLRSSINPANNYRDESVLTSGFQAPAHIHFDIEWGVDSAARLQYNRVSNIRPLYPKPLPPDLKLKYRLTVQGEHHIFEHLLQPWACALCSICAPFPTKHVLQVHLERAHPQVQITIGDEKHDIFVNKRLVEIKMILPPVSVELVSDDEEVPDVPQKHDIFVNKRLVEIKMILPPASVELVSDDEEVPDVPQVIAPSTRIGAMLASRAEFERGQHQPEHQLYPDDEPSFPIPEMPDWTDTTQSRPKRAPKKRSLSPILTDAPPVKNERNSPVERTPPMQLEPIARRESQTPEPALTPPIRNAEPRTGFLHPYSSRVNNQGRIYDVLREIPTKDFGILSEQVLAAEEELFAKEATWASEAGVQVETERGRLMCALWARWITTNRNKFIKNPFECIDKFLESGYGRIVADHVGHEELLSFLLLMVTRRFIVTKQATTLMRKFRRYVEQRM
ncbi:unnamed protein product [Rhizoctonia solani]|uniref:Uncharacterized protein n=1 Tax=Rhizoctonia solani TaxID=456999 RepID=A0A8H3H0W1_9AGAM|nr:unnamed protein product [Rhizoctonia solani]